MGLERLVSSGGVVFRRSESQVFYLLLGFRRRNIWCLPKGLIELGETEIEAATREVREETGVSSLKLIEKIGTIRYQFGYKDKRFDKTVHFFLFETDQVETTVGTEHDMYTWLPFEKAIQVMSYPNERDILERANMMVTVLVSERLATQTFQLQTDVKTES
jgi:8-oxo-dGTP pyrophosphatase MutT (NUDIX family)